MVDLFLKSFTNNNKISICNCGLILVAITVTSCKDKLIMTNVN